MTILISFLLIAGRSNFDSRTFSRSSGSRALLNRTFGYGDDSSDGILTSPIKFSQTSFYKLSTPHLINSTFDKELSPGKWLTQHICLRRCTVGGFQGVLVVNTVERQILNNWNQKYAELRTKICPKRLVFRHIFWQFKPNFCQKNLNAKIGHFGLLRAIIFYLKQSRLASSVFSKLGPVQCRNWKFSIQRSTVVSTVQ